jgi:DNA-binding transcriptional LysR family regulator
VSINFELLDLKAFLAVFDLGSFHKAGQHIHLSQPALSRRIKSLEERLGTPLLQRSTRRVSPTAAGIKLEPMARRLVDELEASLVSINGSDERQSGQITIGGIPSAVVWLLPSIMARFHERFPLIHLRVMDRMDAEVLRSVLRGDVEFGISLNVDESSELNFTPLMEDPYQLVCRRKDAISKLRNVKWRDLAGYPLIRIGRANSGNRALLDRALAKANLSLEWFYEVYNLDTALRLVEAGLGVSVLPRSAIVAARQPALVAKPLGYPSVSRTIGLVERRNGRLSPPAQYLREMLLASKASTLVHSAKKLIGKPAGDDGAAPARAR